MIRACSTIASALGLIIVIAAIVISISNQSLQQQAAQQQQIINQSLTLSQINARLANSLAVLATRDNDEKARQILIEHGITINAPQTTPAQTPSAAPNERASPITNWIA